MSQRRSRAKKSGKLGRSLHDEADVKNGQNISEKLQNFKINLAGSPNSCIVKIGKHKFRSLVDTGAEVSLMHRRIYDQLKVKPRLQNKKINLQGVNGELLNVDGCIDLTFSIGGIELQHAFYIVRDMNRNLILGQDWLKQNGVRLYFDLGCLRINGTYVNLEEDIHIASIVRMKYTTVLKPQTAQICFGKVRQNPDIPCGQNYQISETDKGFISKEPGLTVINTVSTLRNDRSVPILIVNSTNKTMKIFRHGVLAKIEKTENENLKDINSVLQSKESNEGLNLKDLSCPCEFKDKIEKLVLRNKDLFANTDAELGHTDTVKMKIDTGNESPIKMRPYRTPINNRQVIDKTIDEMLDANIVRRSRSPWSFPVVIVDKKDGS